MGPYCNRGMDKAVRVGIMRSGKLKNRGLNWTLKDEEAFQDDTGEAIQDRRKSCYVTRGCEMEGS